MDALETYSDFSAIRQDWILAQQDAPQADPVVVLRDVVAGRQIAVSLAALRRVLPVIQSPRVSHGPVVLPEPAFFDSLIPLLAARNLRLEHAFTYLARRDAALPVEQLRDVLSNLFVNPDALDAMLDDLDADGDRCVTLADFLAFAPANKVMTSPAGAPAPTEQTAPPPSSMPRGYPADGTISPLQMQTGFFRLLQGAAYRTFRESYAANSESHLRARDLPYTVADFAAFVRNTTGFYLSLGLVSGDRALAEFHRLVAMVDDQHLALVDRIARWDSIEKTNAMILAEAQLDAGLAALADHRQRFSEAVDYLLALRQHGIPPAEVRAESLTRHEMDRLRHHELATEHAPPRNESKPEPYHDRWSPVILSADAPRLPGTIMPVAFWYDSFMPQLLLCASILSDADLDSQTNKSEAELVAWHRDYSASGAFDRYGTDLRDGFLGCPMPVKRMLRQAWRLSEHYLNSLQKRREREEFGRETGYLSQYVSFVDLHLGRTDVADAEMRISFPYFIGPAVWCFLHTAANLAEDMPDAPKAAAIEQFVSFFRSLATMYPCPYCRYHLNRYVARNREVNFYPVEFLLLGQKADRAWFDIALDDRLATISALKPGSLRLFVWKLHNAVSSSIARTEEWYHREEHPLYTTRFWPGLDTEIARMRAKAIEHMPVGRLAALYSVIKPSVELATLRDEIQLVLPQGKEDLLEAIATRALACVARLETAMLTADLLRSTYLFDPLRVDPPPHLTEQEEAFSRSGFYVER